MKRICLIIVALVATLGLSASASARLGMAPLTAENDGVIQVRGGHGHGHGHGHRGWHGNRGHHYGWYRGRGHHYGLHRHHRY